jgi:hypothetical protein
MLTLLWNLSAAIRGYLRFYMPTNIALDLLRTPRGLKWALPVGLVVTPAYLGAMAACAQLASHPGLGWLNLLVLLFFWNAVRFAAMGAFGLLLVLRRILAERLPTRYLASVGLSTGSGGCGDEFMGDRQLRRR